MAQGAFSFPCHGRQKSTGKNLYTCFAGLQLFAKRYIIYLVFLRTIRNLGRQIMVQDAYCQDKGTLWLLHRNLAYSQENATMWYWACNQQNVKTFSKEEFVSAFYLYAQRQGEEYNKRALEKEFDCFKNTYVSDKAFDIDKVIDEDTIPFCSSKTYRILWRWPI